MKYLILLLLSFNAFAGGFWPVGKRELDKTSFFLYASKEKCEESESYLCYDIDKCPLDYCEVTETEDLVLDYVAKSQEQSCIKGTKPEPICAEPVCEEPIGEEPPVCAEPVCEDAPFNEHQDCDDKFSSLICDSGSKINNYDLLEVYCATDVMRFAKKLQESPVKKAAYEAEQSAKASLESAMNIARKAQACGKDTTAYMLVRNASKNLTRGQVKQLVKSTVDVKNLLESGSLESAKEEINATVADGVLITEADKVAIVAYIDGCKP